MLKFAAKLKAIAAGYTVHGPCDGHEGYAFCIDGEYSCEFATENEAWSEAILDSKIEMACV